MPARETQHADFAHAGAPSPPTGLADVRRRYRKPLHARQPRLYYSPPLRHRLTTTHNVGFHSPGPLLTG